MSNLEKVKNSVDFLKVEANQSEYSIVKCGKNVYNYKKHQLNSISHSPTKDFFLIPKNSYNQKPFGNSQFYIDFEIPKIQYSIYEFVLRFNITNTNSKGAEILPLPLIIDRVTVLKNSNSLANDTYDWDILLFNLNKYFNDLNNDDTYNQIGVGFGSKGVTIGGFNYMGTTINSNQTLSANITLPISLNYSSFPLDLISNEITLRIYFKSNLTYEKNNVADNTIGLSNVGLVLRVNELSNESRKYLCCQPKLNHMFNKQIFTKININSLTAGQNYQIVIPGFRQVASSVLIFFTNNESNREFESLGQKLWHQWYLSMGDVYFTDSAGRNILNNNKYDQNYNNYLISNHFGQLTLVFYNNTAIMKNKGELYYLPFYNEESDSFKSPYASGYAFKDIGDYSLNFVAKTTHTNVILNNMV